MAANSSLRRVFKRVLWALLPKRMYAFVQAMAISFDLKFFGYKEPELQLVRSLVHPGDVVIDVGANFGQWSVTLSKYVGPAGRVVAFEPVDYTYKVLLMVLRVFGCRNVITIKKAAASMPMSGEIRVPVSQQGTLSTGQAYLNLSAQPFRASSFFPQSEEYTVEAMPLDSFGELLQDRRLSLIKIDVEGAEIRVLEGAQALILASRPVIVCEINPAFVERVSGSVSEILAMLDGWSYDIFICARQEGLYMLKPVTGEITELNYVLLPREKVDDVLSKLA